jgi:hypothetical protein
LTPGSYSLAVTDAKGCADDSTGVMVFQPPLIVKFSKINVTCMGGTDGSITARPDGGLPPYQYSLSGPVNVDFRSGNIFSNLPAGTYTVTVRDSKACTNSVNVVMSNGTVACIAAGSTSNSASASKLNTYNATFKVLATPNPSRTDFTLNLQSSNKERVQIIVTDLFGKKLYQTTGSANQRYTFGKEFSSGAYIVQVIQGKEIQTLKLIKGN